MQAADIFVVLDNVKFCKNEFYNRNKFKNLSGNDEWFTITVEKDAHKKNIKDVVTADPRLWRKKLLRKLELTFKEDFSEIYSSNQLIDINMSSIEYCRKKLNIETPMVFASSLNIEGTSTERLVNICTELNATKYLSGPNGVQYLEEKLFGDNTIIKDGVKIIDQSTKIVNTIFLALFISISPSTIAEIRNRAASLVKKGTSSDSVSMYLIFNFKILLLETFIWFKTFCIASATELEELKASLMTK